MKLVIELELNNEAFQEGGAEEVARILEGIGERVPDPLTRTNGDLSLHDRNGNWVGFAKITGGNIRLK
jgi:hypothetical protein